MPAARMPGRRQSGVFPAGRQKQHRQDRRRTPCLFILPPQDGVRRQPGQRFSRPLAPGRKTLTIRRIGHIVSPDSPEENNEKDLRSAAKLRKEQKTGRLHPAPRNQGRDLCQTGIQVRPGSAPAAENRKKALLPLPGRALPATTTISTPRSSATCGPPSPSSASTTARR